MIKRITLLLFIGLAFSQDITIAVMEFKTEGIEGISSNALSAIVRSVVRNNKNYRLVDRSMMEAVLQEQGFQQAGVCGNECAVEVGQLLGVQKMVTGNINALGSLYLVEIFILNVGSGEIEKSEMFQHVGKIEELVAPLIGATKKMFSGDDSSISQIKPFIYVESVPSGAMVYVDNKMIGSTPIKYEIIPGNYLVMIKSQGFQDWSQTISISQGDNKVIKGTLSKVLSSGISSGSVGEWEIWGVNRDDYLQLVRLGINNDIWVNELIDLNVTVERLKEYKSLGYPIEFWASLHKILASLKIDISSLNESGDYNTRNMDFLVRARKQFPNYKINDLIQELETFEGGLKIFLTSNIQDIKSLPDNLKKWIYEKYNCDDFDCYFRKVGEYKNITYVYVKDSKQNINYQDIYSILVNMSVSNLLLLNMNKINEKELYQILIDIYK
jgi:hypothetical protein